MRTSLPPLLLATAALLVASCGGVVDPGGGPGEYTAQVTGEVNETFQGRATHGPGGLLESHEYAIRMPLPDNDQNGIFLFTDRRPSVGRYPVALVVQPEGQQAKAVMTYGSRVFPGTAGEMEITTSNSEQISGTFRFTVPRQGSDEPRLTVSGSFTAR